MCRASAGAKVYAPSDPILSNPLGVPEVARENPDRLKRAINQPPEWLLDIFFWEHPFLGTVLKGRIKTIKTL